MAQAPGDTGSLQRIRCPSRWTDCQSKRRCYRAVFLKSLLAVRATLRSRLAIRTESERVHWCQINCVRFFAASTRNLHIDARQFASLFWTLIRQLEGTDAMANHLLEISPEDGAQGAPAEDGPAADLSPDSPMTPEDDRGVADASDEPTPFQRGLACYRRGEFDKAVEHFTAALAVDPDNAEAYAFRADTNRLRCDYQQAVADYTQALRLRPTYAQAYIHRSLVYQLQGNAEAALEDCSAALVHDPENAAAYQQRGRLHANRGNWEEAMTDLSRSIAIDPRSMWTYYHRGRVHIARGTYDDAVADLSQVLRRNPNHVLAFVERGRAFLLKGIYDRTVKDETAALGLHPENVEAYTLRGDAYRLQGEAVRAIADYSRAVRLDPERADVFRNRGLLYRLSEQLEQALADLEQAVRLGPSDPENYYERGQVLIATNEFGRAVADFSAAVERDTRHTRALLSRALTFARLGRSAEVHQDCTRALEIDPTLAAAYYLSGSTYLATGHFAQAMMTLSRAIAADGSFPLSYSERGLACLSLGNHEQAVSDFNQAIHLDGQNALAYANRGLARMVRGESGPAAEDFSHALRRAPKLLLSLWHRGWAAASRQECLRTLVDHIEGRRPQPVRAPEVVDVKRDVDDDALAILTGKPSPPSRTPPPAKGQTPPPNGAVKRLALTASTQTSLPAAETAIHSVPREPAKASPGSREAARERKPETQPAQKARDPGESPAAPRETESPRESPAFEPFDTKCPICKKPFRATFLMPGTAGRVKCPSCVSTFVPGTSGVPTRKGSASKSRKGSGEPFWTKRRLVLVASAVALLLLALGIVQMLPHKPPVIRMDAAAFWQKYKASPTGADKLYANQIVSLTGKVDELHVSAPVNTPNLNASPAPTAEDNAIGEAVGVSGRSKKPQPELFLEVPDKTLFRIKCIFSDPTALEGLKKDQAITITGNCQHQLGPRADIRIIGCRLEAAGSS